MASLFAEVYADFIDTAKVYQEKLDITPISFMRRYTRAIQEFQRDTEYVQAIVDITRNLVPPFYVLPRNCIRIIEVTDSVNRPVLINDFEQHLRNTEIQKNGTYETPIDFDHRLAYDRRTALGTVYNREVAFQGSTLHPVIRVYYIPDIPAFTAPEPTPDLNDIWAAWFPIETNFETMFTTMRVRPELAPFEQAFLERALGDYIRSLGNSNYRVFEDRYRMEVENAKFIKPTLFKEGVSDYFLAPYS